VKYPSPIIFPQTGLSNSIFSRTLLRCLRSTEECCHNAFAG